jgi:hypothetical protein
MIYNSQFFLIFYIDLTCLISKKYRIRTQEALIFSNMIIKIINYNDILYSLCVVILFFRNFCK